MNVETEKTSGVPRRTILVVEDHQPLWDVIRRACRTEPWHFEFFASGREALEQAAAHPERLDLAVVDLRLPDLDGTKVLHTLHAGDHFLPIIMLTAFSDSATVVRCTKLGAYDYITKPFNNEDLTVRLRRALEKKRLSRPGLLAEADGYLPTLMGPSQAVRRLTRDIQQISPTEMAVVIQGESGTGKELLSRHIHSLSPRKNGPFVAVDCGAIPDALLEGELFGFKKGSFTGAVTNREGKFHAAHGGTLFLDEIGNLPLHMQAKVLRALQQREVAPIGASAPVPFSARLITATNTSLEEKVKAGEFRLDLFHRIAEFPLRTTPLRERPADLLYLCTGFLREACTEFGKPNEGFSEEALEQILAYAWPGNVRELKSVIRRAALVSAGRIERVFGTETFLPETRVSTLELDGNIVVQAAAVIGKEALRQRKVPLKHIRRELVRRISQEVLDTVLGQVGGNKSDAARILELDYKTVYSLCKRTTGMEETTHGQAEES